MDANVFIFPLTLRSPFERRREGTAAIVPFPFSRRRDLVERLAREMRGMSDEVGETFFAGELERVCSELRKLGLDCETAGAVEDLAIAVGRRLVGPNFVLERTAE